MAAAEYGRLHDSPTGYGWISIALHWLGAIVVMTLWLIGISIESAGPDRAQVMHLHTSIAVSAYVLLWLRVIWRFRSGHPGPRPQQRGIAFNLGKWTHLGLAAVIGLMLISGPLMVWTRGEAIHVFEWRIESPFAKRQALTDLFHQLHAIGASFIILATVLHFAGVYKHAAFNRDGTFTRMMVAARRNRNEADQQPDA